MSILLFAFLIGIIAGLRAVMAPTVVSWAAGLGWLQLEGSGLTFLIHPATRYILSVLALAEVVNDKLPKTPSRKVPPQFIARKRPASTCSPDSSTTCTSIPGHGRPHDKSRSSACSWSCRPVRKPVSLSP
jgi:hypothetical protein